MAIPAMALGDPDNWQTLKGFMAPRFRIISIMVPITVTVKAPFTHMHVGCFGEVGARPEGPNEIVGKLDVAAKDMITWPERRGSTTPSQVLYRVADDELTFQFEWGIPFRGSSKTWVSTMYPLGMNMVRVLLRTRSIARIIGSQAVQDKLGTLVRIWDSKVALRRKGAAAAACMVRTLPNRRHNIDAETSTTGRKRKQTGDG